MSMRSIALIWASPWGRCSGRSTATATLVADAIASTEAVTELMRQAGLVDLVVRPGTDDTGDDPFGVLTAVGTKPT